MGFGSPFLRLGIGEEPGRDGPAIHARQPAEYRGEEKSPHQSPAWAYVIKYPDGTTVFLTSMERPLSIANLPASMGAANPQEFTPTQVKHGIRASESKFQPRHVNLIIQSDDTRLRRFLVTAAPCRIEAWILRFSGDKVITNEALDYARHGEILENGILGQFAFNESQIMAEVTPEVHLHGGGVPNYWFSRRCNNVLYGPGCGLDKADHKYETTIVSLNPAQREMVISGQRPASAADYFGSGYVYSEGLGQSFAVGWSEFSGGDTKLKLVTWHPEFAVSAWVTAYAGCLRTVTACRAFNNAANFRGFPYVPTKNPATNGL